MALTQGTLPLVLYILNVYFENPEQVSYKYKSATKIPNVYFENPEQVS